MSLTLEDLRIITGHAPDTRPATLEELVEVLKQEGAEEINTQVHMDASYGMSCLEVAHGRYLVLPLDGTTPK